MVKSDFFLTVTIRRKVLSCIVPWKVRCLIFSVQLRLRNMCHFLWIKIRLRLSNLNYSFFLPATLDRKEDILQWKDNVHLHPIDLPFDDLQVEMSVTNFDPSLLENDHARESLKPGLYKVMKKKLTCLIRISYVTQMQSFLMEESWIARESLCELTILLRKEHQNFN